MPSVFELDSRKPLDEIDRRLREAAERRRFGVIAVHDLRDTMRKKGVEYGGDCVVYEICNPQQAKKALEAEAAVSSALPCRISVYGTASGHKISTILPTAVMQMFQSQGLDSVARDVEADIVGMMKEAQ